MNFDLMGEGPRHWESSTMRVRLSREWPGDDRWWQKGVVSVEDEAHRDWIDNYLHDVGADGMELEKVPREAVEIIVTGRIWGERISGPEYTEYDERFAVESFEVCATASDEGDGATSPTTPDGEPGTVPQDSESIGAAPGRRKERPDPT